MAQVPVRSSTIDITYACLSDGVHDFKIAKQLAALSSACLKSPSLTNMAFFRNNIEACCRCALCSNVALVTDASILGLTNSVSTAHLWIRAYNRVASGWRSGTLRARVTAGARALIITDTASMSRAHSRIITGNTKAFLDATQRSITVLRTCDISTEPGNAWLHFQD